MGVFFCFTFEALRFILHLCICDVHGCVHSCMCVHVHCVCKCALMCLHTLVEVSVDAMCLS